MIISAASFPAGSVVKNLPVMQETACSAGAAVSIPGLGSSPGEGNGNPLLPGKSCGQRSLAATVHGAAKESDVTEHIMIIQCTNMDK